MCDCYKVGGPWVAEDPDCPVHGRDAQLRDQWREDKEQAMQDQIDDLYRRIQRLEDRLP